MNDNPPSYTPLVLLKSSWRKIRKPIRKTIFTLGVPKNRETSAALSVPGETPNVKLLGNKSR